MALYLNCPGLDVVRACVHACVTHPLLLHVMSSHQSVSPFNPTAIFLAVINFNYLVYWGKQVCLTFCPTSKIFAYVFFFLFFYFIFLLSNIMGVYFSIRKKKAVRKKLFFSFLSFNWSVPILMFYISGRNFFYWEKKKR